MSLRTIRTACERAANRPSFDGDANWPGKSLNLAERGVLQMLADGMSTKRMALEMHVAERTARDYMSKAVKKLRATSWAHAVALAMRKKVVV